MNIKKNSFENNILEEVSKTFEEVFDSSSFEVSHAHNTIELSVKENKILSITKLLKDNDKLKFNQLIDITAVDYPSKKKRFEMVYIFLSIEYNKRLILKFYVEEDQEIDSLTSIFPAANWYEREVWDLFGIAFKNHPDLRRLLTDYGFIGHPLRKDFPLSGNVEVKYDLNSKKVIYEPIKLTQSFRTFDFESPWEGETLKEKND